MKKEKIYKYIMAFLAIIDIALIVLDFAGLLNINQSKSSWFWLNNLILIIFAIDYFYRLYYANNKKEFVKTHIFDLLAIIPVGLVFNWMQLTKLGDIGLYFRLLRLIRLAGLIGKLHEILHASGLLYVLYFSITFLMLGSVAISITEHVSLDKAFWWAITTASTVGYGDISKETITPESLIGKMVTLIMILVGVGVMGMVTSSLTAYLMRRNAGKSTLRDHDNIELILAKLDSLQKQNDLLMKQTQKMQEEIDNLKANDQKTSQWGKFRSWIKSKK